MAQPWQHSPPVLLQNRLRSPAHVAPGLERPLARGKTAPRHPALGLCSQRAQRLKCSRSGTPSGGSERAHLLRSNHGAAFPLL
ncbi:hypothetical protein AV530_020105 [Patagioenas fasciata monilis]|uniref:Uncharacterized protein n=1 Tax=Patagioenas fasciata monilis TaxID=372326 RepID=A0A1V4JJ81_PATFA|nr:hypothetical protein AV530_020105 [Patagioenas fasciata monilis]